MTWRDFFDRYGVALGIVAVLALVLVLLPGNENRTVAREFTDNEGPAASVDAVDQEAGGPSGGSAGPGSPSGSVRGGSTGAGGAKQAVQRVTGGASDVLLGKGPCRKDGRMLGVSIYAPPCLSWIGKDNGGATARGVTRKSVKVVRWLGQVDPGTRAILEANRLADSPEVRKRSFEALFRYNNQHLETYGREVQMIDYPASGPSENDEAMKADAVKIANDIKAFAVIVGTPDEQIPTVLGRELAHRGVICICTVSLSSTFYRSNPPYIFSQLPTSTEYAKHVSEYIGKRLKGRKAKWAGDEHSTLQRYRTTTRKFGLIYVEGSSGRVDPELVRSARELETELGKRGVKLAAKVAYLNDPGRNQVDITNMIASMKGAGVTTVIMYVDPLNPILITTEATRQDWYPEWFIAGTGLSDTTTAGRLYNSYQWRHAFGISPLWVTWEHLEKSGGYRAAHHGDPSMRKGDEGVLVNIYSATVGNLFFGIQLAGPRLTADTFAQGMFRYPRTGGLPGAPLLYVTRQYPTLVKDFTEVWFDVNARGPDEREQQGDGMMMKVAGGKRYQIGRWPSTEPKVFQKAGAIAVKDGISGSDPPHEQDGHKHSKKCLSCSG